MHSLCIRPAERVRVSERRDYEPRHIRAITRMVARAESNHRHTDFQKRRQRSTPAIPMKSLGQQAWRIATGAPCAGTRKTLECHRRLFPREGPSKPYVEVSTKPGQLHCRAEHALVSVGGGGFQGPVDAQLAASGVTRNIIVSVPSFLAGIDLVRQSNLLLSIPTRLAQNYRGLIVTRPLPVPSPSFDVTLVWHARTDASRPHAWFRALLSRLSTGADPHRLTKTPL